MLTSSTAAGAKRSNAYADPASSETPTMLINDAKCPRCGTNVTTAETVNIRAGDGVMNRQYPAVAFVCPAPTCHAILGVTLDQSWLEQRMTEVVSKAVDERRPV
jgi:hypothetical protein